MTQNETQIKYKCGKCGKIVESVVFHEHDGVFTQAD